MKNKEVCRYTDIKNALLEFDRSSIELKGIMDPVQLDTLVKQIVDSIRRIEYVYIIGERNISNDRLDPFSVNFDPIKAAFIKKREGDIDEAFWLIFLAINFGKNLHYGWTLSSEVYRGADVQSIWTWSRVCGNLQEFKYWIEKNSIHFLGKFGNHRKYESLRPDAPRQQAMVIASYVNWVGTTYSHNNLIDKYKKMCVSDSRCMFSEMYKSMNSVLSFGRTARFDYLTMIAKVGLVDIEPDSTYMSGATGPLSGAKLLFAGSKSANLTKGKLEIDLKKLEEDLPLGVMGMQVLEDSLCNWQKSPNIYKLFKG